MCGFHCMVGGDMQVAWGRGLSCMGGLLRQVIVDGLGLPSQESLAAAVERKWMTNVKLFRTVTHTWHTHIVSNLFRSGSDREGWVVLRASRR